MNNTKASYLKGEEFLNASTHGLGVLLAIFGLILLILKSTRYGTAIHVASTAIFGSSMIILYLASTMYHSLLPGKAKGIFKILDHTSIFILIAGTYTPFTLVTLQGGWGWSIFGAVWGLAVLGIVLEAAFGRRVARLSLALYLVMGWIVLIAIKPLVNALPAEGLYWLLAGGVSYTLGVIFYVMKKIPYTHSIWHLFVLGGTICHFFAIYNYVLPDSLG